MSNCRQLHDRPSWFAQTLATAPITRLAMASLQLSNSSPQTKILKEQNSTTEEAYAQRILGSLIVSRAPWQAF